MKYEINQNDDDVFSYSHNGRYYFIYFRHHEFKHFKHFKMYDYNYKQIRYIVYFNDTVRYYAI